MLLLDEKGHVETRHKMVCLSVGSWNTVVMYIVTHVSVFQLRMSQCHTKTTHTVVHDCTTESHKKSRFGVEMFTMTLATVDGHLALPVRCRDLWWSVMHRHDLEACLTWHDSQRAY